MFPHAVRVVGQGEPIDICRAAALEAGEQSFFETVLVPFLRDQSNSNQNIIQCQRVKFLSF
jgi:hypothetical protein